MRHSKVRIGKVKLTLPVATTSAERERGLMFREKLGPNEGMVFDYGREVDGGFWMKNTSVPLQIAYVDSSGEIFQVSRMKPHDETPVNPSRPYRWAVEMPDGWFDEHLSDSATFEVLS